MPEDRTLRDAVGPVFHAGTMASAVVAAIEEENENVTIVDRGAYVRVLVPARCRVTRAAIERHIGRSIALRPELERIMTSFKGRIDITMDDVTWVSGPLGHERKP
ncbi:MAG: MmoB/DmpM family protein [Polyangiaceae bacterium]|nr:MmoB/DmpM family protein [Polyangiaceae bacterium]